MLRKKRKVRTLPYRDIELNIMPFIDVFSMLNTFLLFSAVFLSIGIIEVQIPFLTNAPPQTKENTRTFDVHVDIAADKVELTTYWSQPPRDEQKTTYQLNDAGMNDLHAKLVATRKANEDTDKVTVFSDDDVKYDQLAKVLDTIKLRKDGDPLFNETDLRTNEKRQSLFLYPKVVIGSVLL